MEELVDITNTNGTLKINLSKFKNGEIKLKLIDKDCKGVGLEANWE